MSYLALYRKYRPTNFGDLVGQTEVSNIIKNEILNNKLSHAYLFSGPRGTGKTSTAKIIAKMINCSNLSNDGVPCGKCESCVNFNSSSDIVEIDAASNNGVDEIRELRDKVNLVPTYGKYKIYIIDEVHMLTTQAFNALLKTLEEPPSHVVFILATTEFYKIPITVVSRCQKFQFFKFSDDDIVNRLSYIADNENIKIDSSVLYEIARLSDGGLRDAINMLDQLSSYKDGEIILEDVYLLNGVVSYDEFASLLKYIYNNKVTDIINFIDEIDKNGRNFERFINDFVSFLKDVLIYKNTFSLQSNIENKNKVIKEMSDIFSEEQLYSFIISLNDLFVRMKNSSFGKILLITELIKISSSINRDKEIVPNKTNSVANRNNQESNLFDGNNYNEKNNKNNKKLISNSFEISDKIKKIRINNSFATASKKYKDEFINKWDYLLDFVSTSDKYSNIALIMEDIETLVVGKNNVIFLAPYDSLLERLFSNIKLIENLLFDVYNNDYKCIFLLNDEWEYEKGKYINNIKSGFKYEYILEEKNNVDDVETNDEDIDKIVSILGNDVISYE